MDWAEDVHIGFSVAVSLGDEAVVGLSAVLDYLASDPRTDSIVLYLEDVGPAREFMSAARRRQREAGHRAQGRPARRRQQRCCSTPLRRAGAVRVRYFVQLFSAVKVLGYTRRPKGRRVALISNGNGPPQLALT